jgi:hypothetical protein
MDVRRGVTAIIEKVHSDQDALEGCDDWHDVQAREQLVYSRTHFSFDVKTACVPGRCTEV